MTMTKHSGERSHPKHLASLATLFLLIAVMALVSDTASAKQQRQQQGQVRQTATRTNPPEPINTTPVTLPGPAIDNTSGLGQALAACNQEAEQQTVTLPGLKGEV